MTAGTSVPARQGFGGAAIKRRRRLAPSLAVSVLVHALLLALAILLARHRMQAPEWLPPPAFEVVPDTGGAAKPSAAAPEPRERSETPPEAAPAPPPAPVPARPSTPSPPLPATPPVPPPPMPAAPPAAAPPVPAAPSAPPLSTAPEMSLPLPAPAEPALPRFEMPEPPNPTAPPLAPRLAFPAPTAFSLGTPVPRSPPERRAGRGIDVSLGQGIVGAVNTRVFGRTDKKEVGPDWYNRFAAWWDRHSYYPPQAGQNGEQGDVVLDLVVLRNGQVERVTLAEPSGSQWLDMAALGVFRGARLPSLPADAAASVPITLRIHYQILR